VRYSRHGRGTSLTVDVIAIVAELHAVPFDQGARHVYNVLKPHERRHQGQTLKDEVTSVQRLLADRLGRAASVQRGWHVREGPETAS
jgi:uncharacterized protein YqgV (UPF0045/DUF77 family)